MNPIDALLLHNFISFCYLLKEANAVDVPGFTFKYWEYKDTYEINSNEKFLKKYIAGFSSINLLIENLAYFSLVGKSFYSDYNLWVKFPLRCTGKELEVISKQIKQIDQTILELVDQLPEKITVMGVKKLNYFSKLDDVCKFINESKKEVKEKISAKEERNLVKNNLISFIKINRDKNLQELKKLIGAPDEL